MSGSMTPEREAELRAKAPFLKNGDKLIEALDAMAYQRARADAAEAELKLWRDAHDRSPAEGEVSLVEEP